MILNSPQEGSLSSRKTSIRPILLILLLAVFFRGVYLYDSLDYPTFKAPVVDARTYDQTARRIAEEGELTQDLFWQPPFYPLFLSSVYKVTKGSILAAKIFQMIIGVLTCVLVYMLGVKLFNTMIGLLAGIMAAVYLPMIFFEGELLATGWAAFWAVTLVLGFVSAAEKSRIWSYFIVGLCGAFSIITRPVFFLFFLAGCIWLVFKSYRQKDGRKFLPKILMIAAGFLVITIPTGILGYYTTGKVRITPFSGGINFYIGNNPNYQETITIRPGYAWRRFMELPAEQGIEDIHEKDKFFRKKAIDYAVNQPLNFAEGLGYKTAEFFSSREIPRNTDMYSFRKWSSLMRFGTWKFKGFGFPFGIFLSLAVVGAVYWWRKITMPVWLFLAFYSASIILIFVASRYRMPIMPVIYVLAAGGIAALGEMSRRRQWAKLAVFILILVLVSLASSASGPFHQERLDYDSELFYFLGVSLEEQGKADKAREAYLEAIRLNPDLADAYYNLGVLMAGQKKFDEAVDYYRQAIQANPDHSHAYYNLGVLYQSQRRMDEAIRFFRETIRIDPFDPYAHNNLGNGLRSQDKLPEAIEHYRLAVKYKPSYAVAHNNLAYALLRMDNWNEAAEHFKKALSIEPSSPPVLIGLARILILHPDPNSRDPGRAILLAEQAAQLTEYREPRILNILAMSYASAGYFDRAITTARKALDLAVAAQDQDLAARIQKRIKLYQERQ